MRGVSSGWVVAIVMAGVLAGCRQETAPAAPAALGPCAQDRECRAVPVASCGCSPALASTAAGVGVAQECFAPPCHGREAYCDVTTHRCSLRPAGTPTR